MRPQNRHLQRPACLSSRPHSCIAGWNIEWLGREKPRTFQSFGQTCSGAIAASLAALVSEFDDDDALSAGQIVVGEGWRPPDEVREAIALADDLIAYSHLREKVRLREDVTEYEEAERLIARADALKVRRV